MLAETFPPNSGLDSPVSPVFALVFNADPDPEPDWNLFLRWCHFTTIFYCIFLFDLQCVEFIYARVLFSPGMFIRVCNTNLLRYSTIHIPRRRGTGIEPRAVRRSILLPTPNTPFKRLSSTWFYPLVTCFPYVDLPQKKD